MQREKVPPECRYVGTIYKLEIRDYDLSRNTGSVYLTVIATAAESPAKQNTVYYNQYSSRFEHISALKSSLSCNIPQRFLNRHNGSPLTIYPQLTFDGSFTVNESLESFTAEFVQNECVANCFEPSVTFNLSSSHDIIYRGPDVALCCGLGESSTFRMRRPEEQERPSSP